MLFHNFRRTLSLKMTETHHSLSATGVGARSRPSRVVKLWIRAVSFGTPTSVKHPVISLMALFSTWRYRPGKRLSQSSWVVMLRLRSVSLLSLPTPQTIGKSSFQAPSTCRKFSRASLLNNRPISYAIKTSMSWNHQALLQKSTRRCAHQSKML